MAARELSPFVVNIKAARLNPQMSPFAMASGDWELGRAIFAPLLSMDASMALKPYLVRAWSMDQDCRHIELTLRDDLRFHHGRPVDAADLTFSLRRGQMPGARPALASLVADIDTIDCIDRTTVRIGLKKPNRMFPVYLTRAAVGGIVPREELDPHHAWRWRRQCVGCGPYRVETWGAHRVVLRRHDGFFGLSLGSPDVLVFQDCPDLQCFDLLIDEDRLPGANWVYRPSPFWSTIALEHYSSAAENPESTESLREAERRRHLRRLIASLLTPEDLLRALPSARQRYYTKAMSFLPPGIRQNQCAPTRDRVAFPTLLQQYFSRWGAVPPFMHVIPEPQDADSDLCAMQRVIGNALAAANLPVREMHVDSLKAPECHERVARGQSAFVLAPSSFNYPDYDNLHLFFAPGGDIHRDNGRSMAQLRRLLDLGRCTREPAALAEIRRDIDHLLDVEQWVYPLLHTPESAYIRQSAINPATLFCGDAHPVFEALRRP